MSRQFARDSLDPVAQTLRAALVTLSQPAHLKRLQQVLMIVVGVWALANLANAFWAIWPGASSQTQDADIINPVTVSQASRQRLEVDLDSMLGLGLFGDPTNEAAAPELITPEAQGDREGIEQGARETRLDLKLTGILASSEDGLGTVIIGAKGTQANYSVGDKLPAAGSVSLAKVMAKQVVIDNNGTYELLKLFDKDEFSDVAERELARTAKVDDEPANVVVSDEAAVALAADYRAQLYKNPDALRDLVRIAAVRENGGLRGYRLSPGRDAEQFTQLGFQRGDIVTAINGYSLADPSNTVRLYQLMRDTTDATFEVERGGTMMTISISLTDIQ